MGLKLNEIFQDGMILQRGKELLIWGTADAGSKIIVEIQGQEKDAQTSDDGSFLVRLDPLAASGEETLTVSDGTETVCIHDIAVGEVWLAGGQSNMEFWMRYEKHIDETRKTCTNPRIRFYDVPEIAFDGQREAFDYSRMAVWRKADPENLDYFSAVGYYFARKLEKELDIPVGIIGCNWGGTTTAAWMKEESVRQIGRAWFADHEKARGGRDMGAYWARMKTLSDNNTGNPFANPFNEKFLPSTPPAEEAIQFIVSSAQNGTMDPEYMGLQPASFPGSLYEHMLKTLENQVFRGVLWYQGESDELHASLHGIMLTRMIADWRALFDDTELPFLTVQLPGYDSWCGYPQAHYKELRNMQKAVADSVAQVYMTSISDVGEKMDIHPKDKKTPGERLCLLALGKVYGRELLCEAPEPDEIIREGKTVSLHFKHAEGGLVLKGNKLNALTVECDIPYTVTVEGEYLKLEFEKEPGPYLWIRHAVQQFYIVNLYNQSGIPAIPFEVRV